MSQYIDAKLNRMNIKAEYDKIKNNEIIEASNTELFTQAPEMSKIDNVLIGSDGTLKSIARLKNGEWLVFETEAQK